MSIKLALSKCYSLWVQSGTGSQPNAAPSLDPEEEPEEDAFGFGGGIS